MAMANAQRGGKVLPDTRRDAMVTEDINGHGGRRKRWEGPSRLWEGTWRAIVMAMEDLGRVIVMALVDVGWEEGHFRLWEGTGRAIE